MSVSLDPSSLRTGRVRGRYFRENFVQGGLELVQVVPVLVTNADAAIDAAGRSHGRIRLSFGPPDPAFLRSWREQTRRLRVPALRSWTTELRCTDDGIGVDAETIDGRLGALGVAPDHTGQRGLFGRGLRDVWLAQGAGRIEGVRGGRAVESWFFPAPGEDPYAFVHVRDAPSKPADLRELGRRRLGHAGLGAAVRHPGAGPWAPADARRPARAAAPAARGPLSRAVARGARPRAYLVSDPAPEPDPQHPVLYDDEVDTGEGSRPGSSCAARRRRSR